MVAVPEINPLEKNLFYELKDDFFNFYLIKNHPQIQRCVYMGKFNSTLDIIWIQLM